MTEQHQAQIDWLTHNSADPPVHIVSRLAAEFELMDDPTVNMAHLRFMRWLVDTNRFVR